MAQRNPFNERNKEKNYGSSNPTTGKTKKSAASAKPTTSAGNTVYKKSKPTTKKEVRAAQEQAKREKEEREARRLAKLEKLENEQKRKEAEARGEEFVEPAPLTKEQQKALKKQKRKEAAAADKAKAKEQKERLKAMSAREQADAVYEGEFEYAVISKEGKKLIYEDSLKETSPKGKATTIIAAARHEDRVQKAHNNLSSWRGVMYTLIMFVFIFMMYSFMAQKGGYTTVNPSTMLYCSWGSIALAIIVYFARVRPLERREKATTQTVEGLSTKEKKHLNQRQFEADQAAAAKKNKRTGNKE